MGQIGLHNTLQDVVRYVTEGNPGALRVCMEILRNDKIIDPDSAMPGLGTLLGLYDMDIKGSKIWVLFKDICKCKLSHFLGLLRANQLGYLSGSNIHSAINNSRDKLLFDKEDMLKKVKDRLPNFKLSK